MSINEPHGRDKDWLAEDMAKQVASGVIVGAWTVASNPNSPPKTKYVNTEIVRGQDIINLVFKLSDNKGFISGGFARWALSRKVDPEIPGDIDIFTQNMDEFEDIRKAMYKEPKIKRRSESNMEIKFEYTLSTGFHTNVYKIQLIRPLNIDRMVSGGTIQDVLDNFDFTIAKSAIHVGALGGTVSVCHPDFHNHDIESKLVVTNIHCPISSMKRVIKYTQRGFKVENAELLKLFKDYEARPADWKSLIDRGVNNPYSLTNQELAAFARGMYMD